MSEEETFRVDVEHERGFVFKVDFGLESVDDLIARKAGGGGNLRKRLKSERLRLLRRL